jgi:cleavage and polyadenylation specificity factor subunit 3
MLLRDFISVSRGGVDEGLYTPADLQAALARTEVIDFHQTLDIDGIKVLNGNLVSRSSRTWQFI